MSTGDGRARTYGGWQREKTEFIFGLSGRRAALLAAAVLAGILPIATTRISEAIIFWPAAVICVAAVFIRIAGRTTDEWAASALSYALLMFRGHHKFVSGPFTASTSAADGEEPMDLPGILAPVRLLSVPAGGRDVAVACHRYDRTYTAVARVRFAGIGLADSGSREQRVAGWGGLLAGLCTEASPLIRVQALQRIVPEPGVALRSWHEAHADPHAPELAQRVTGELMSRATLATSRREAYLAFTMDEHRARTAIRGAGGGETGAVAVLLRHLHALGQAIGGADLEVEDWLGGRDLAEVIQTAYDPWAAGPLAARRAAHAAGRARGTATTIVPGVAPGLAGPVYAEAKPGTYLHDGAISVTYWVQDWPRSQTWCTALAPLLAGGTARRSLSLIAEPLAPRAAEREVMRERTARHVAVRMRQRTGQIVPEHEQAAMERARWQDAERAAGHGLVRFAGYATVTVTDPARLDDACAALEADAAAARIEIRRMWFAQDCGFAAAALPLGLGLPRRRW
jgi:hypothetical protein